jgi:YidC/Oxa1 family membrane protein insertase
MDDDMIQILGFLAGPLAWVMRLLYGLIQNYGWTIIVITFILRLLMFPLTMMQQKSQARMSAYQPMIQEIQKKWANDKNRQNQEVMKFQEENNIKMSAGCLPMVVNMIVLFSLIVVIQSPLTHMLQVDEAEVNKGIQIVQAMDPESRIAENTYTQQSILIGEIIENPNAFIEGIEVEGAEVDAEKVAMDPSVVEQIRNFKFDFLGLNLAEVPKLGFNTSMILPILSILTMFAQQFITIKTSGQNQMGGQMWVMTIVMGLFFGWYAFTVPVGFSLYYTASNVVMTLQQFLVKRIYDPGKIKQQIIDEIEEKKKAKKAKKKVAIKDESGQTVTKEVSDAELVKIRLAKARQLDEERYGGEASAEEEEKAEKARKADKEKYAAKKEDGGGEDVIEIEEVTAKEETEEADAAEEDAGKEKTQPEATKSNAKPGRRKRAKQNKQSRDAQDDEGPSFAEQERAAEAKQPEEGE